jgi:16S rRNA (cytidine1402-2'-O)-methyltransferase
VATPIGNKNDITLRALATLREVEFIAAEDTRKTYRFLAFHNIKSSLISYHEHNEEDRTPKLIKKLKEGLSIALVSNAGTPSISDPGYRLIQSAISHKISVVPLPGVSAATHDGIECCRIAHGYICFCRFSLQKKREKNPAAQ